MENIGKPKSRKRRPAPPPAVHADPTAPAEAAAASPAPAASTSAAATLPIKPPPARPRAPEAWMEFKDVNTVPAITESTDRLLHALEGRFTLGLSPASLLLAYLDWQVHLANSAGKTSELIQNAMAKGFRFAAHTARTMSGMAGEPFIEPLPQDTRFSGTGWRTFPFNIYSQAFLLIEQWWHYATTDLRGVSRHHQEVVSFAARQILDIFAPSNFPLTNPDVVEATWREGGANLQRGMEKLAHDMGRLLAGRPVGPLDEFRVGTDLACTPGKVVFRNQLIELIQYSPTTETVFAEPILVVPAWIMKYYILDLSPHNSMVRYLVSRGYTVFMMSWRNPGPAERDFGMEDYLHQGVVDSLAVVNAVRPGARVHGVGYCLGGTLLTMAAAVMARDGDDRLRSLTLFAAQTDFEDPGEIMLFIDESQVTFLEDMMWDQGYLDTKQMAGAFQLLRSNDLIWSRMIREYLLGQPEHANDLMAWNSDATRMPYRMHSEYLRHLFLDNLLAQGLYGLGGRPIALTDIRTPICAVGTTRDHVAPWKSVFKIGLLADTETTFILTSGGHNAGIVSEPGHPHRSYQIATHREFDRYVDPDTWVRIAPRQQGSWWPAWVEWLDALSGARLPPPPMGAPQAGHPPLYDAPGEYVLMR